MAKRDQEAKALQKVCEFVFTFLAFSLFWDWALYDNLSFSLSFSLACFSE